MILTNTNKADYNNLTLAKSNVEIDLSVFKGDTSTSSYMCFFCVRNSLLRVLKGIRAFMVGCVGETSVSPFPLSGKVNPAQSTTHDLTFVCGSNPQSKETVMPNINTVVFNNTSIHIVQSNNELYFKATDLCRALDYPNARQPIKTHVDSEDVRKLDTLTNGGKQKTNYINESGMYALVFGSKKPVAKQFKRWVTSEVLPEIRKTGSYQPHSHTIFDTHRDDVVTYLSNMHNTLELIGRTPPPLPKIDAAQVQNVLLQEILKNNKLILKWNDDGSIHMHSVSSSALVVEPKDIHKIIACNRRFQSRFMPELVQAIVKRLVGANNE